MEIVDRKAAFSAPDTGIRASGETALFRPILAISIGMLLASNVQAADVHDYGQGVSQCSHLADAQKVKGQARTSFIGLCTARGMDGPGQSGRYKNCSESAHERGLTGDARSEFVESCADLRVDERNPTIADSLQQSQQYCSARADPRQLAGDARLRFIDRCLDRDRGLSDQLWNRHQQCHERARDRGLTGDRRREFIVACLDGYRAYDIASNHLTTELAQQATPGPTARELQRQDSND